MTGAMKNRAQGEKLGSEKIERRRKPRTQRPLYELTSNFMTKWGAK
jgi:hypothetical protein